MTTASDTELPIPAWFKYRQGKAEPAGENCYQLTAPVAEPAVIRIRARDGGWEAALAGAADGPDRITSGRTFPTEREAWAEAFEMYRSVVIF